MAANSLVVAALLVALAYAVLHKRQAFSKFVYTYVLLISVVGWISWPETRFAGNEYLRFAVCVTFYVDFQRVPNPSAFATLALLAILALASGYIRKEKLVFLPLVLLAMAQFYGSLPFIGPSVIAYLVFLAVFIPVKLPVKLFIAGSSIPLAFVDVALAPDSSLADSITAIFENIGFNRLFLAAAGICSVLSLAIPKSSDRFPYDDSEASFGLIAASAILFIFSSIPAAEVNFVGLFFSPTRWIVACLILISYLVWKNRPKTNGPLF